MPIEKGIFIDAVHIPAILNVKIDQESRKSELRIEWKLHESVFGYIQKYLDFYSSVDLFTSRINAQLSQFVAYWADPKGKVTNAFSVSWYNLSFYYFLPFSCIEKILQKNISDNANPVLVVPNWPSQFWFTILQDLLLTEAFIIPTNADNLYLLNQPDLGYPFLRNLKLMVCLVSGKALARNLICPVEFWFWLWISRQKVQQTACSTFKEVV